jgi:hypothetical protein
MRKGKAMDTKIQRVELNTFYHISIFCPFCGAKVSDFEAGEAGGEHAKPCPHTLFIAHDEGFEYRSVRFDEKLNLVDMSDDEIDPGNGIDGLTDSLEIEDGVKFASYVGPPSGFGTYVGFAPIDSDGT